MPCKGVTNYDRRLFQCKKRQMKDTISNSPVITNELRMHWVQDHAQLDRSTYMHVNLLSARSLMPVFLVLILTDWPAVGKYKTRHCSLDFVADNLSWLPLGLSISGCLQKVDACSETNCAQMNHIRYKAMLQNCADERHREFP